MKLKKLLINNLDTYQKVCKKTNQYSPHYLSHLLKIYKYIDIPINQEILTSLFYQEAR